WKISFFTSAIGNHHLCHPLPPKDPSKPLSKIRSLTTLNPDKPHHAAVEDEVLIPIDENLKPLAIIIHQRVKDAKAQRAIARWARSVWTSKVNKGTNAVDLKSSNGDDTGKEGYRDFDDFWWKDFESPRAGARAVVHYRGGSGHRGGEVRGFGGAEVEKGKGRGFSGHAEPDVVQMVVGRHEWP
ncbi:hypothetical protein COCNU_12G006500, partial [Cocos nucifera]